MNDDKRQKMALWRYALLGPLVSAKLEHGDRQALLTAAAARVYSKPDGCPVEVSARTLEDWYYRYREGGLEALAPQARSDQGRSRVMTSEVVELVLRCKRERPRRSIRRIIRMLERAKVVRPGALSHSTVHRVLQAQGISAQPKVGPDAERRSFLSEHAGDLWVGDALHLRVPVLGPDGKCHKKVYLLTVIDGATRFVLHSELSLSEGAVAHERALKQALLKHGRPRVYYVDRGSAYVAGSLQAICAQLGIFLLHTEKQDPEAKGVIERWHRTWRAEVEQELGPTPLPLDPICAKHWAWLAVEYHARVHDTTQRAPLAHFLAEVDHLRPLPRELALDEVFLHRVQRKVRKDGTVRFQGAAAGGAPRAGRAHRAAALRPDGQGATAAGLCARPLLLRHRPAGPARQRHPPPSSEPGSTGPRDRALGPGPLGPHRGGALRAGRPLAGAARPVTRGPQDAPWLPQQTPQPERGDVACTDNALA